MDTVTVLTDERIAVLKQDPRIEFVGRYIDSLTSEEIARIHAAGLALTLFTYANELDPGPRLAKLKALKIPAGTTIWLDIEGEQLAATPLMTAINFWAGALKAAQFDPGEYAGAGEVLTSAQLTSLAVDRYCRGCSSIRDVEGNIAEPFVGYAMYQLYPPNQRLFGSDLLVDWDCAQQDFRNRPVVACAAGPT